MGKLMRVKNPFPALIVTKNLPHQEVTRLKGFSPKRGKRLNNFRVKANKAKRL